MIPAKAYPARDRTALQRGFSLIELMVVIAILGILSLIAWPNYQRYAAKATLASALAELSGARVSAESLLAEGTTGRFSASDLGVRDKTEHCDIFADAHIDEWGNNFTIMCRLTSRNRYISRGGRLLVLWRDTTSKQWACYAKGYGDIMPTSCKDQ